MLNIKIFLFIVLTLYVYPLQSVLVTYTDTDLVTDLLLSNTDYFCIKAIICCLIFSNVLKNSFVSSLSAYGDVLDSFSVIRKHGWEG